MTFRDLIVISIGNLRRMKLRTLLTTSGVLIAIAAFVSMLSFGAGNQELIQKEFNRLGLFSTLQVYPKQRANAADTTTLAKLDRESLDRISTIPGVNLVYPYDALPVTVRIGDSTISSKAQALPTAAMGTKLFSKLLAGSRFDSNSARQAIISEDIVKKAGIAIPDSILGRLLTVSVRVSTIDSAIAHVYSDRGETLLARARRIHLDSLLNASYRTRVLRTEASEALRRFVNGLMNAQGTITDTLTICGVRPVERMGGMRIEPIIIPVETAGRFSAGGFGSSPTEIFSAISSGNLFPQAGDKNGKSFSQVTVDFDPKVMYKSIRDSVEAMGFRTFSFAAQFEEMQKVFFYFDLGLGVVGLIALITASLGIVNTMIMSISERRREIGVLKSLGADDMDIRGLFLVESGVIGLVGTGGGILFGWIITRIVSALAQAYMKNQGIPQMDLFSLPPWLILTALCVGVAVSVAAGFYPAARAARVDPVEALRNE